MSARFTHNAIALLLVSTLHLAAATGVAAGGQCQDRSAGDPRLETVEIHGAERTRPEVVIRAAGLKPGQALTPEALERALRRLHELPVASTAQMKATPIGGCLARLDIVIKERKVAPSGWLALATLGGRAAVIRELKANVAGPLGAGELMSASWRWSSGRPRVTLGLALPVPRLPGILSIDGLWERQTYLTPSLDLRLERQEERRRVGVHLADWSTHWLQWRAGAAFDRLREYGDLEDRADARNYVAVDVSIDVRPPGNRFALTASGSGWTSFAGAARFGTGGLLAAWRSTDDATVPSWSLLSEVTVASRVTPLALWHGAGSGKGRSGLLRAHPLTDHGVLVGPVFGRRVAQSTLEYVRPVKRTSKFVVSIAGFADAARAWHRLNGLEASPMYVDVGAGLRVFAPGAGGAIRIDVAHGLRGGGTTLSAAWGGAWPR